MTEAHSSFSPSQLERILQCPGSVSLINTLKTNGYIPQVSKSSTYAEQGTKLHAYLAPRLNPQTKPIINPEELSTEEDNILKECKEYADTLIKANEKCLCYIEQAVSLESWGIPEVYGTVDFALFNPYRLHVDVIDWKFGSGIMVFADRNPQLLAYLAGIIKWPTKYKTFTVHIFQPYLDHISTYDLTLADIHKWIFGKLAPAIFEASHGEQNLNPSEDACRWCDAKNYCRTRFETVKIGAVEIFDAQSKLPDKITPEELVKLLVTAPLVEQAIKDIKLFVKTEIERGAEYPGMKLVHGRSIRKWKDEMHVIKWLNDNTKIQEIFNSKLKSPSQIEKELTALKKNKEFQDLYEKPEGTSTLVFDTDPRPAIPSKSVAINVFKDYKGE